MQFDVVIAGAGAAGLMCAIEAGKRGRSVAVLDHMDRIGRKILISGGGRCNFTNLNCRADNFLSSNPHFCKSALARYTEQDFVALVQKHGIRYHEKTLGQLFCDGSASEITSMLHKECESAGVRIFLNCCIERVERSHEFTTSTSLGEFRSGAFVVATGGLSIPKIGASPFGYRLANQFGLTVRPLWPALVPLTLGEEDRRRWCDLSGVSASSVTSINGRSFREKLLITHRGLSGPSVLQISTYWNPPCTITIDLLPGIDIESEFHDRKALGDRAELRSIVAEYLPKRLADRWFEVNGPRKPLTACSTQELNAAAAHLHRWNVAPSGTEGYEKAEVTGGGVDTNELSSKTFEARKVPGLYFIGEVVDVTGHLGGFNFQWAWSSGWCAGQAL
jgi:predicted Rossmann fold flavoprotein